MPRSEQTWLHHVTTAGPAWQPRSNNGNTILPAMGIPEHPTIKTAADAFAAVALAAVACDGELAAVEARSLRQQLEFRLPFRTYSDAAMAELLDRLLTILRLQGWPALVAQAAPCLNAEQSETALAVAASLTQADHVESSAETSFLGQLSEALSVAPDRAATIREVVALLNRDSLTS